MVHDHYKVYFEYKREAHTKIQIFWEGMRTSVNQLLACDCFSFGIFIHHRANFLMMGIFFLVCQMDANAWKNDSKTCN